MHSHRNPVSNNKSNPNLVRRVFLMGPTGSFRQDNALFLAEHFGWKCISTGDLLRKEVLKKNTAGIKIKDAFSKFEYGK
jgi:adenylate kinase